MTLVKWLCSFAFVGLLGCNQPLYENSDGKEIAVADSLQSAAVEDKTDYHLVSRTEYLNQLEGFWLGLCIANWTGLITEFDKVNAPFYTDNDWGRPDQPNAWGNYVPHTNTIDFYFVNKGQPWGADDDSDMEYLYQYLLETYQTSMLTPEQIRAGWLKHIYSNEDAPFYKMFPDSRPERENFLWVSNEKAYYLMKEGLLPPATSEPEYNVNGHSIDAQLTTEIFGVFAPARPDVALAMAELPVRVTAKNDAEWAAKFYVLMHSLASLSDPDKPMEARVFWMADQARTYLPADSSIAKMYDFVKTSYENNPDKDNWEKTRDEVYQRYQMTNHDGYIYREGFDAGINFASSMVSLFYGQGDIAKTIKIASLTGWDSDNPAATWGGLLGFMLGKSGIEKAFNQYDVSNTYWIHRTRRNFPDHTPNEEGEDTFNAMAERGIHIIDRVVTDEMGGRVNLSKNTWFIPVKQPQK